MVESRNRDSHAATWLHRSLPRGIVQEIGTHVGMLLAAAAVAVIVIAVAV